MEVRRLGVLVIAAVVLTAVLRAGTASFPPVTRRLSLDDAATLGRTAAEREPRWRAESKRSFPGDHWSQDDDFSARERQWALDESRKLGVPVSEIFRAIEDELRANAPVPPPRKATAAPSNPRPFYD